MKGALGLSTGLTHGAVIEGRRIEVNQATPRVRPVLRPRAPFMAYRRVNCQSQMLELVEAQTRLAEAQLAVLQMRNTILDSQDRYGNSADVNNDALLLKMHEESSVRVLKICGYWTAVS